MISLLINAWRNFSRNMKRYRVLLSALILVTTVLVLVLGVVLGMRRNLYEKASRYFAGNIVVLGYGGDGRSVIEQPEKVLESLPVLASHNIPVLTHSLRSSYYDWTNLELFYAGYYARQRRLVGVEWALEAPVLERFDLVEGSVPEEGDQEAILISTATARQLTIGAGDSLLVSIRSDKGRNNTVELYVRGIFAESSFFGYTSYIHRQTLNRLREAPEERINEIGVYLENPERDEQLAASLLAAELEKRLPGFGVIKTREAYSTESYVKRDVRHYGVVTVGAQLEEIEELIAAVTVIAAFVVLMFLVMVVVGVGNTFSAIVWERSREIGTLRALGVQKPRVVLSFLAEAVMLGLAGVAGGLVLGVAILEGLRNWASFSPNVVTSLFLTRGRLPWLLPAGSLLLIAGVVVVSSLLGALRAALKAGRLSPVEALSRQGR
jgi:ABC-type lipoprotein release transport system permease subunit